MSFAIVGSARTGSTYLTNLLHSHPDIFCNGEICHNKKVYVRWHESDRDQSVLAELERLRNRDPQGFLSRIFAMNYGRKEVGFKILRGQNKRVFKAVLADKDIKKIVLFRRNILANYSSKLIARDSGKWHQRSGKESPGDPPNPSEITFNEEDFVGFCAGYNKYYEKVMQKLNRAGQYYYLINYEDINEPEIFANLLRFMGSETSDGELSGRIVKQNRSHILSRFANANEVEDFLQRYNLMHWAYEGELSLSAFSSVSGAQADEED